MYQVGGKEFDDWTIAQDQAVQLLEDGIEYVTIMQWDKEHETWGLLQELNLERGIMAPSQYHQHHPTQTSTSMASTKALHQKHSLGFQSACIQSD